MKKISKTQINGSVVGFLLDGRELNYEACPDMNRTGARTGRGSAVTQLPLYMQQCDGF